MRGKEPGVLDDRDRFRITPAYAGKRVSAAMLALTLSDHPRVCGEKTCFVKRATRTSGSPPRMRGKEHYAGLDYNPIRITPAYAGKRFVG